MRVLRPRCKSHLGICASVLTVLLTLGSLATPAMGATTDYPFSQPGDYTVSDATQVSISNGLASLSGRTLAGTGADGPMSVSTSQTLSPARTSCTGTAGSTSLTVTDVSALKAGQVLLLHQTQGAGAGVWEEATIASITNSTTVALTAPLKNSYSSIATGSRAQAVVFYQWSSLTISSGGTLTGPSWNGTTGGILAIKVSGQADVQTGGTLSMARTGFRGTSHGGIYRNTNGFAGESHVGPGAQTTSASCTPNGTGGCGGYQIVGKNGSGGAGGGYGTKGANTTPNVYGVSGVAGGDVVGDAALVALYFGGAGGEGSADEDGYSPGAGGNSGGILFMEAGTLKVSGSVSVNGAPGGAGVQSCSGCGGGGMAGGGGGAGGALFLRVGDATLGANTLLAQGGAAGAGTESNSGGLGGVGRIRLDFQTLNGNAYGTSAATTALSADTDPDALGGNVSLTVYSNLSPYVQNATSLAPATFKSWSSFAATLSSATAGQARFLMSDDGGTTFKYWNGSAWASTSASSNANTASDVNLHIAALTGTSLVWRAYLVSDGTQKVELDAVQVGYTEDPLKIDNDSDGYTETQGDCDDSLPSVNPGAAETCNAVDDNCNGSTDEGVKSTFYADADNDGYGNAGAATQACSVPSGYVSNQTDCDDTKSSVNPGATEVCNSIDDNCNGSTDEGVKSTFYADADNDGYGDANASTQSCSAPSGYVSNQTDCNDTKPSVNPGAAESCNGIDDNCNGSTDEGVKSTFYADADNDGYGDASATTQACSVPSGYVSNQTDCDDTKSSVNPGATEVCNSIDDNCNGSTDEGVKSTFYADADNDGYGDASASTQSCSAPSGYVSNQTDCDDTKSSVNPGATESCNGIDDNCNGSIDEEVKTAFYPDADADGYGDTSASPTFACTAPIGYVTNATDCNDANVDVHLGALEVPYDDIDQDCDGSDLTDVDQDGYDAEQVDGDDCNDEDASVHPGATEIQNGTDDNCDGLVDEGTPGQDLDQDGYSVGAGDCNDDNASIHPDATEVCDTVDQNCNGIVDEHTACYDDDGDGFSEDGSIGGTADCDDSNATTYPGATEYQDGKDNDCDGVADNHLDSSDDDGDGLSEAQGDCNDGDASVHPGTPETCNNVDDNCSGVIDEGTSCHDDDGDGYSEDQGDCNDGNPDVYTGAPEGTPGGAYGAPKGDGLDNNCNATIDEGTDAYDDDGDLYVERPEGSGDLSGDDCNDADADVHPGATEVCDGIDQDCDGVVDEGTACYDDDGDGFSEDGSVGGQEDCDDAEPMAYPGSTEPENGVADYNCDGTIDEGDTPTPTPDVTPTPDTTPVPTDTPVDTPTEAPTEAPTSPTPGTSPTPDDGDVGGGGCNCSVPGAPASGQSHPSMPLAAGLCLLGMALYRMKRKP